MTVSSDATSGTSAAFGGRAQPGQAMSGFVPVLADCFTPRPHTGSGPLSSLPEGRCVVLTGPPRPRDAALDLSGGTGKTQLAASLARNWLAETPDGLLIWLDAGSRDALLSGYAQAVATAEGRRLAGDGPGRHGVGGQRGADRRALPRRAGRGEPGRGSSSWTA